MGTCGDSYWPHRCAIKGRDSFEESSFSAASVSGDRGRQECFPALQRWRLGQLWLWNPTGSWCLDRWLWYRWWQGLLEGQEQLGSQLGRAGLYQDGAQQEPVRHCSAAILSNRCQGKDQRCCCLSGAKVCAWSSQS